VAACRLKSCGLQWPPSEALASRNSRSRAASARLIKPRSMAFADTKTRVNLARQAWARLMAYRATNSELLYSLTAARILRYIVLVFTNKGKE
jgi:hypothetical protein